MLSVWTPKEADWTHVEDVKDPDKVLLPSRDLVLIDFGEHEPVDRTPFTLLDDLPLDLGQSSVVENVSQWVTLGAH